MNNGQIAAKQLIVLTLSIVLAIISYFIPLSENPSASSLPVSEDKQSLQPRGPIPDSEFIYNGLPTQDLGLLNLDPILIPDLEAFTLSSMSAETGNLDFPVATGTESSFPQAESNSPSPEIQFFTVEDFRLNHSTENSSAPVRFLPLSLGNFTHFAQ